MSTIALHGCTGLALVQARTKVITVQVGNCAEKWKRHPSSWKVCRPSCQARSQVSCLSVYNPVIAGPTSQNLSLILELVQELINTVDLYSSRSCRWCINLEYLHA